MNVSQYIAAFLADRLAPARAYGVCGGGAMYLNDAIINHPGIQFTAMHHEQAAAFAAEADARVSNKPAIVHVTAGPGVTNIMTGAACAWADSLPMIIVAGQVESRTINDGKVRQLGISEINGPKLMAPITKMAAVIDSPHKVRALLEQAMHEATTGRMGPVYLEVPLDVQRTMLADGSLLGFHVPSTVSNASVFNVSRCVKLLEQAERPVIIIGNGIRLAGAAEEVRHLRDLSIPILCSWSGADLISSQDGCYIGRPGLIGDRAANYAVQNADLVLAIGTRLSIPLIGHAYEKFASKAKIVVVDIDDSELRKRTLRVDLPIAMDAKLFLTKLRGQVRPRQVWWQWLSTCRDLKNRYPVIPPTADPGAGVQVYQFLGALSKQLEDDAIIVTDVGMAFVCTMQAMPTTWRRRMFHSPGIAPMGYGLPAAIGAYRASGGKRQVICLTGDGGTMFNLQELQTIVHHQMPIKIFVYANRGYKTMQTTQENHFKRESASSSRSGLSWPDFVRIAHAFGIDEVMPVRVHGELSDLPYILADRGPRMIVLDIDRHQQIEPLVKTRVGENGMFLPTTLDDMHPPIEITHATAVSQ